MQPTRLQIDNLTVESFPTEPQPMATIADEPNFMLAKCTGCMSGCGIMVE
jgi:hypothetical protein